MKQVVFMGTPDYAAAILKELIADQSIEILAVFTQPDKPVGRKKIVTAPPVKILAQEHGIEVFQPRSLKKEDYAPRIAAMRPDFIIVAAFGQILPQSILDIAPCINLHASILPAYRGASPIQNALLNGDTKTGVTAMLMDAGMDTGAIITIEEFAIPTTMLAPELLNALTDIAARMTPKLIHQFDSFSIQGQDEQQATHCKKIAKADGEVRFDNARALYNRYRAFTPWPGIFLASSLKLIEIEVAKDEGSFDEGAILHIEKERIEVGCTKGSLYIYKVQPASKSVMPIASYINGKRLNGGDTLV